MHWPNNIAYNLSANCAKGVFAYKTWSTISRFKPFEYPAVIFFAHHILPIPQDRSKHPILGSLRSASVPYVPSVLRLSGISCRVFLWPAGFRSTIGADFRLFGFYQFDSLLIKPVFISRHPILVYRFACNSYSSTPEQPFSTPGCDTYTSGDAVLDTTSKFDSFCHLAPSFWPIGLLIAL